MTVLQSMALEINTCNLHMHVYKHYENVENLPFCWYYMTCVFTYLHVYFHKSP